LVLKVNSMRRKMKKKKNKNKYVARFTEVNVLSKWFNVKF